VNAPPIGALRQPPAHVIPERPRRSEPARNSGNPTSVELPLPGDQPVDSSGKIIITFTAESGECNTEQTEGDQGAFLLPVWDRGFWVMPPGGMTRFLIPSRTFISPDQTLAPGPVIENRTK
jgi:hypothetical protein